MDCPRIGKDFNEKGQNIFAQKWTVFTNSTEMTEAESHCELYQCCEEDLGDVFLKGHADVVNISE